MPQRELYLIRRLADGTVRTVEAMSPKGAMRLFVAHYGPPHGEEFAVKPRLHGDWEFFSVTRRGLRRLAS